MDKEYLDIINERFNRYIRTLRCCKCNITNVVSDYSTCERCNVDICKKCTSDTDYQNKCYICDKKIVDYD